MTHHGLLGLGTLHSTLALYLEAILNGEVTNKKHKSAKTWH